MAIRTLTIEPFGLVGNSNPEVVVTISLVDENEQRIQGLVAADGSALIDRVSIGVHQEARTVDLYPQPDLVAILNWGSDADPGYCYYLVDIVNQRTRYHSQFRTTVADGDPELTWAEFANGQGPLEGGDLPAWQTHMANDGIHVPAGGDTEMGLVKLSADDGDTEWRAIGIIPSGGTTGQALSKLSDEDLDIGWEDAAAGLPLGGDTGEVLSKDSAADLDVSWQPAPTNMPIGGGAGQVLAKSTGADFDTGWEDAAAGLPVGGDTGEVLSKDSAADLDVSWQPAPTNMPIGGGAGQVLAKSTGADFDTGWIDPPDVHTLSDYGETAESLADGGAIALDISIAQSIHLTLTADAVSFAILNPSAHAATSFSMLLTTGGFDVTNWSGVAGWFGAVPDLSSGGTHGFGFELVDGNWYGTHKGQVV